MIACISDQILCNLKKNLTYVLTVKHYKKTLLNQIYAIQRERISICLERCELQLEITYWCCSSIQDSYINTALFFFF